jgi:hypothetical protein
MRSRTTMFLSLSHQVVRFMDELTTAPFLHWPVKHVRNTMWVAPTMRPIAAPRMGAAMPTLVHQPPGEVSLFLNLAAAPHLAESELESICSSCAIRNR